jgi:hypothetical protein
MLPEEKYLFCTNNTMVGATKKISSSKKTL